MIRTRCIWPLLAASAAASLGLTEPFAVMAGNDARTANGRGVMVFGEHGDARGWLRFSIREDGDLTGTLLYAAEDHHHFPDIVVELGLIDAATFTGNSVSFSGPGGLHDDPVNVIVEAYDRGERGPDRFVILCTDQDGAVVFEADGELIRGDIIVDSGSSQAVQGVER